MRTAAFELPQEPGNTSTIPRNQAQRQRQHLSRARTASPRPHARHARTNEIEIDFPVSRGDGQAELAPPKPPIYMGTGESGSSLEWTLL